MQRLLFNTVDKKRQYLYCTIAILTMSLACYGLSAWIGYRVVAFILLLTVSILAIAFQLQPVLFAAALSAVIWDFFFIPPKFTIHVDNTEDSILLTMYFVIAMINGVLTYKIRRIEKALRAKEDKANSVKLYNTILNSLSHELRTPIAAIIGATDNLQFNKHISAGEKEELISEISKASLRLNQQVDNLLNISRLESGHIQPKAEWTDIIELIYDVVKGVEENNPGRKINININPQVPMCKLDKGMLYQIIYNLVNNAAIHTYKDSQILVTAFCHSDLLQIEIEDSGGPLSVQELSNLFDHFSGSNKIFSGTKSGLGLSIVKGFAEALGGNVILNKSKSGGAQFTIILPVITGNF